MSHRNAGARGLAILSIVAIWPASHATTPSASAPYLTAHAAPVPAARPAARGGSIFFSDGFEGGMGGWTVSDLSDVGAQWGDWDCWSAGGSRSAGCAAAGTQAIACGEDYRDGMKTWMVAGPFDLSQFFAAEWEYTFTLESEAGFDLFFAGISTDGVDFTGTFWSGRAAETVVADLPLEEEIWIGFQFVSDPSAGRAHGAQVDDVVVRASSPGPPGGFGWTISDSGADPRSNAGSPANGLVTLYLWFYCADATTGGVGSAEFSIRTTSGAHLAFTAMNGFLNAGSATDLLLASACRTPPIVAGSLLFLDQGTGIRTCLGASPYGWRRGVDCNDLLWPVEFVGYDSTPARDPCISDPLCASGPSTVEARSWGSVKALYR